MKKVTRSNYQKHKLYPAVVRAVAAILETSNFVAPVELLIRLQRLSKQHHEDWRFGRAPYLERVCAGSLPKMSAILRILEHHATAIGLKPSHTVYHKWGKEGKRILLRFSRFGEPALEAAYSRHYVKTSRPLPARGDSVVVEPAADCPGELSSDRYVDDPSKRAPDLQDPSPAAT
jgi:hypothetical protein